MGGSDIFGVCSRRGLKGLCAARLLWVGDSVVVQEIDFPCSRGKDTMEVRVCEIHQDK